MGMITRQVPGPPINCNIIFEYAREAISQLTIQCNQYALVRITTTGKAQLPYLYINSRFTNQK